MFTTLNGLTADDLWLKAAAWFQPGGIANTQGSRAGNTREVLRAALSLGDSRQRWVASREPAMNPAFAIAEVVWLVNGRNDSAFLNYFNPRLPAFAGKGDLYFGAYGFRLRKSFGVDQLTRAASTLRSNPDSRQVVLQIWNSASDLPDSDGKPVDVDVPCNIMAMLKVRAGKLEWTQVMRSNDLFLGFPHNVVQFSTLQEIMAGWIGVQPGEYHHLSNSFHLYEKDDYVLRNTIKQPCPQNDDHLNLPEVESKSLFGDLERAAEKIICPEISSGQLIDHLATAKMPQSFVNLLAIMVADGCYRRGQTHEAEAASHFCLNPCLTFLWKRWLDRKARQKKKD